MSIEIIVLCIIVWVLTAFAAYTRGVMIGAEKMSLTQYKNNPIDTWAEAKGITFEEVQKRADEVIGKLYDKNKK